MEKSVECRMLNFELKAVHVIFICGGDPFGMIHDRLPWK